ncbi:hypothetical protein O181_107768 [Austropuccinia psidii MF-1]|uniref:Uncharacterized protein n=1 Tax=Austropuccinia psidii MF-1 TaxID=1389203 RepID=A0A9Q3PN74_9BASI|nr:hypothetical protein [Austropuccinia psidii MF-1]
MQLLSPPPPGTSFQLLSHISTSAYNRFMQEPYRATNCFGKLQGDGSNFPEWVASLNRVFLTGDCHRRIKQSHTSLTHLFPTTLHSELASFLGVQWQRNSLTLSRRAAPRAVV